MAKKRRFGVRLFTEGKEKVIREFRELGSEGKKAGDKIESSSRPASKGLKAVDNASKEVKRSVKNMGESLGAPGRALAGLGSTGMLAAAGLAAATAGVVSSLRSWSTAEEALIRLEAVMQATGVSARVQLDDLVAYSDQMELATRFTSEQIQTATAQMLTFKTITGEVFQRGVESAMDLSAVFGNDLKSTILQVGKALSDPLLGMSALKEVGVEFNAEQRLMIQQFVESNELIEAQNVILNVLEGQVADVSERMGSEGLAAAGDNAANALGNLLDNVGELISDGAGLEEVLKDVTNTLQTLADFAGGDVTPRLEKAFGGFLLEELEDPGFISRLTSSEEERAALIEDIKNRLEELEEPQKAVINITEDQTQANKENTAAMKLLLNELDGQIELAKMGNEERRVEKQFRDLVNQQLKQGIVLTEQEKNELRERLNVLVQTEAQAKERLKSQKKQNDLVGDFIGSLKTETQLTKLSATEREVLQTVMKAENLAKRQGIELSQEHIAVIRQEVEEQQRYAENAEAAAEAERKWQEEAKQLAEEFNRPIDNTLDRLQNSVSDKIRNGFRDGFDDAGDIVKDFAAEMATLLIFRPQVFFQGGLGGAFDAVIRGGTTAGANPAFGGGGGLSIGSIGSFADTLGLSSSLSGIGTGIDQFAFDAFGIGQSIGSSPFYAGIGDPNVVIEGTGLTSQLGSTFSGAYGGAMASLLGLGSGNAVVDTGTSLAGAAVGNLIAPGIGGVIGSFAGSALGGLFGGSSRPRPTSNVGTAGFDATGGLISPQFSSKHLTDEFARSLADSVQVFTRSLSTAAGVDFSFIDSFQAGVDDGRGFYSLGDYSRFDENTFVFDPEDAEDAQRALSELGVEMLRRADEVNDALSDDLVSALQSIETEGRSAAEVLEDIFTAAALKDVNISIADQIAEILAPGTAAIKAETKRFEQQLEFLRESEATQADIQRAQTLHTLHMAELLERNGGLQSEAVESERERLELARAASDTLASQIDSIDQFLFELDYGRLSLSNPTQNAADLKALIQELDAKALLGDSQARDELLDVAPAYLELVGEQKRFNDEYAEEQKFVRDIMQGQRNAADRQLDRQGEQVALAQKQIDVLESGFSELIAGSNLSAEIAAINASSIADYAGGGFSASNPNEIVIDNREAIEAAGLMDTVAAVLTSLSPGVQAGGGRRSLFFESQPAYAAQVTEIFRAMGIPGFAKGGSFGRGLAMVGEEGMPELVEFRGSGRIHSGRNTRAMMMTAVNDNYTMQNEIRGLRDDFNVLAAAILQTGEKSAQAFGKLDQRFGRMEADGVLMTVNNASV